MNPLLSVILLLFSALVFSSENTEFSEFQKKIASRKTSSERLLLLQQADALLATNRLSDEETAYVLHRAGLICIREACFDKTSDYLARLESLLTHFDSLEYLGKLNLSRGNMAITRGNDSESLPYLQRAAELFNQAQLHTLSSHAYRFRSRALYQLNRYSEAFIVLDKASQAALKAENIQLEMAVIRQKSDIYEHLGLIEKSLELKIKQLEQIAYLPQKTQEFWIRDTLIGLASNYAVLREHQKSYDYFLRVLEIDKRLHSKQDIAITLKDLAVQSTELRQFQQATEYFKESIALLNQLDTPMLLLDVNIQMGRLYLLQGDLLKAQLTLENVISRLDVKKHINSFIQASFLLIEIHLKQSQFEHALELMHRVNGLENKNPTLYNDYLSQALSGIGDFSGALAAHKTMHAFYRAKLEEQSSIKTLALASESEYQIGQYELKQAKSQQALLEAEQKFTRYLSISIVAVLMIIILFVLIISRQRRQRLEQEAQHLNQALEFKKQLLADVSHELRTPLSVLKLHLEALEYNLVSDPQSTYKVLHRRLDNLNLLISDIYELAQADTGAFTLDTSLCNANALFDDLANQIKDVLFEHELQLELSSTVCDDVMLDVDVARMHQVVANLSRNSIHYTDKPGRVFFQLTLSEDRVLLLFSDSSPGVKEHDMPYLFERLFRCDKSRSRDLGGSGLGLSICQKIVEAHHGKISASHSTLGGLKIEISLPKAS